MKVMYFGGEFCHVCKVFRPQVEKECERLGIELQYVDVEESPDMAVQYAIRNVPQVILFDDEMNMVARGMAPDMLPRLKEYAE